MGFSNLKNGQRGQAYNCKIFEQEMAVLQRRREHRDLAEAHLQLQHVREQHIDQISQNSAIMNDVGQSTVIGSVSGKRTAETVALPGPPIFRLETLPFENEKDDHADDDQPKEASHFQNLFLIGTISTSTVWDHVVVTPEISAR